MKIHPRVGCEIHQQNVLVSTKNEGRPKRENPMLSDFIQFLDIPNIYINNVSRCCGAPVGSVGIAPMSLGIIG